MAIVKKKGKAISIWVPPAEAKQLPTVVRKANQAQKEGPKLSSSYIVRALLKAYEEGLEVPGLPCLRVSETTDTQRGSHGPIRQNVRGDH